MKIPNTFEEVLECIDKFCEEDQVRAFSFGHIVLGDQNLEDEHIKFCLRQDAINNWFVQKLKDIYRENYEASDGYRELLHDELAEERDKIIAFLRFLLAIPEDIRLDEPEDWR